MLKKEYLIEQNKRAKNANKMGPYEWYKNEATRAVNQAIGRVIRHENVG
jgi:regulator of telomere elongation helicase 1